MPEYRNATPPELPKHLVKLIGAGIGLLVLLIILSFLRPFTTVKAGHVGVSSLFGKIDSEVLPEGFHFINPLKKIYEVDCRNQEHTMKSVGVPSQDQLTTQIDITVKWRVDRTQAARAYQETGGAKELEAVHLIPEVRSSIREAGIGVAQAEDFYRNDVQAKMRDEIKAGLLDLGSKGILVEDVLMRQIVLPSQVQQGVLRKKEQEQRAEQQKAELERFKTETEQTVAKAEADRKAAIEQAEQRKALADAKAYEITAEAKARAEAIRIEGEALRNNPQLIQLRSIEQWDGILPRVNMGNSGAIPMLNLGDLNAQ